MRKRIVLLFIPLFFFALFSFASHLSANELDTDNSRGIDKNFENEMTPEIQKAINKGLNALAKKQNSDGSWGEGPRIVATTQAALAFMSNGSTPERGKYKDNIAKALNFIMSKVDKTGFITESSRMYSHGFATLFLAEIYGTSQDKELNKKIKKLLTKATNLIVRAQGPHGLWDYSPSKSERGDISVSICQAMALRAAKNVGIKIDSNCIEKAIKGIKKAARKNGMINYTVPGPSNPSNACTSAGVCILQSFGEYDCIEVIAGLKHLEKQTPDNLSTSYYYANYYCGLAMFQASNKHWKAWWPKLSKSLLLKQKRDGSWSGGGGGANFSSGMALILLQLPYRYLPIVQN